jgi:hypothetical protein
MPFYDEWVQFTMKKDLQGLLVDEMNYIERKRDEPWFVINNINKGYLYIDNLTLSESFDGQPHLFIDSRIPLREVTHVLKMFKLDNEKVSEYIKNIEEYNISNLLTQLETKKND